MKFGKKLQHQLDHTLPDWKNAFLNYKSLKKRLKSIGSSFGSAAPMTFLTAAIQIVDENPSIEDEFLLPVATQELSDGEDSEGELGQKRKAEDGFLFEEHKKRKCENATESFSETQEPSDRMGQEQCDLIFKENVIGDFPEGQEPSVSSGQERGQSPSRHLTEEDENFLRLVKTELQKFNSFFLEKEEEFLIRLSILEEKTDNVKEKRMQTGSCVCDRSTYEQLIQVQIQIVTLHGELVLLMNYSSLNYVGLLKILKKYDKHTKSNLRQLVHGSVLQQPFVSITNLKEMIARSLACEDSLQSIFPTPGDVVEPIVAGLARDVAASDVLQSEPMARQIRAALQTMQEIR